MEETRGLLTEEDDSIDPEIEKRKKEIYEIDDRKPILENEAEVAGKTEAMLWFKRNHQ